MSEKGAKKMTADNVTPLIDQIHELVSFISQSPMPDGQFNPLTVFKDPMQAYLGQWLGIQHEQGRQLVGGEITDIEVNIFRMRECVPKASSVDQDAVHGGSVKSPFLVEFVILTRMGDHRYLVGMDSFDLQWLRSLLMEGLELLTNHGLVKLHNDTDIDGLVMNFFHMEKDAIHVDAYRNADVDGGSLGKTTDEKCNAVFRPLSPLSSGVSRPIRDKDHASEDTDRGRGFGKYNTLADYLSVLQDKLFFGKARKQTGMSKKRNTKYIVEDIATELKPLLNMEEVQDEIHRREPGGTVFYSKRIGDIYLMLACEGQTGAPICSSNSLIRVFYCQFTEPEGDVQDWSIELGFVSSFDPDWPYEPTDRDTLTVTEIYLDARDGHLKHDFTYT